VRRSFGARTLGVCACVALLAGAAGEVLLSGDGEAGGSAALTTHRFAPLGHELRRAAPPAAAPPATPPIPPPGAPAATAISAAAIASTTWAARPSSLDDAAPGPDEVEARGRLGGQELAWLAEEDDPDAALVWAEQLGEVAPWLSPADRARLLDMARNDPVEARRRAALVALGAVAAHDFSLVPGLAAAYSAYPTPEARAGLEEALARVRGAGGDPAPLERALEAK
jgi:hypothetical protein